MPISRRKWIPMKSLRRSPRFEKMRARNRNSWRPSRNGPIAPTARCRQSGIDHRRVARSGPDAQSATPGPVKPAANQCPRFPSLDRLGLCDSDRLSLSVDRRAASSRAAPPSAAAQSAKSSSSSFATGRDGAEPVPCPQRRRPDSRRRCRRVPPCLCRRRPHSISLPLTRAIR